MSRDIVPNLPPVVRPKTARTHSMEEFVSRFARGFAGDIASIRFTGLSLATADLRSGEIFVGLPGLHSHGAQFADVAEAKGAVALVTDERGSELAAHSNLPIVIVDEPRRRLGDMTAWVYGTATDDPLPTLFAVTGTNGKTSVTHLLEALLRQIGERTGLSSTAERHIDRKVIVSRLTTPEASEMHALLARMRERHVDAVCVEVSAQSLTRHRVDAMVFDVAGFTNLTHDHLGDYADMSAYLEAKLQLFTPAHARRGVVSLDSSYGAEVADRAEVPVTTVVTPALVSSELRPAADWVVEIVSATSEGTVFTLTGPVGQTLTTLVPVIGAHMASNAALAIVMLTEAGYEFERIAAALTARGRLDAYLPGRAELVSAAGGPQVYVDFGHSADAFEKTLAAVRHVTSGKVLMLFGADGDRDPSKRHAMGAVAAAGSDILVITDHHPRFEDPQQVRTALLAGARDVKPSGMILEVSPPEEAIVTAISLVGPGDAILWAGPGHQDYRDITGVRTPYSARELTRRALLAAGWAVRERRWKDPYGETD